MPTHSAEQWSSATNTAAWPSPVIVVVRSVPHIASSLSGMIVPSWLRGPRGEPTRVGASRLFCRISRSTRRNEVRVPACRNRAQTLRCPSPWNGLAESTPRIAVVSASSDIAPADPRAAGPPPRPRRGGDGEGGQTPAGGGEPPHPADPGQAVRFAGDRREG